MSLLALCLGLFLISAANGSPDDQFVQVQSFMTCPEYPDLPNRINDDSDARFRRDPTTEEYFMTGKLIVTKPILEDSVLNVNILSCMDPDPVSCNGMYHFVEPNFCAHIADTGKVWSPIVEKMKDFDPTCPIATGEYLIDDALIDMSVLTSFNAPNNYYQIQLLFTHLDEPMMCVVAEGQMRRIRKKKPTKIQEALRRKASKRKSCTKSSTSL